MLFLRWTFVIVFIKIIEMFLRKKNFRECLLFIIRIVCAAMNIGTHSLIIFALLARSALKINILLPITDYCCAHTEPFHIRRK